MSAERYDISHSFFTFPSNYSYSQKCLNRFFLCTPNPSKFFANHSAYMAAAVEKPKTLLLKGYNKKELIFSDTNQWSAIVSILTSFLISPCRVFFLGTKLFVELPAVL